ncbi:hypothetical protein [Amycolatopsis sp. cmx-11-12]|uniref:hypothetical protein n=1 Tax=Amycolatopsis sp. cmx-11-12 TaxID=2785795 RepID=UPI003918025E
MSTGTADLLIATHPVLLAAGVPVSTVDFGDRRVLAEVTSRGDALEAVTYTASGW